MNQATFRAMGTEVVARGDDVSLVAQAFVDAEAVFSRFDPDSELSAVNRSTADELEVSSELADCLAVAADLRRLTDGLIDPAVGNAVIGWGYDRTFKSVVDRLAPPAHRPMGDWSIVGNVVRRRPGTYLDLGGIAKGWTADRVVERGQAVVVSAGGDVRSRDADTTVTIQDPWGEVAASIVLGAGGLATSSTRRRRWRVGRADAHHIIDPRLMQPAVTPVFSATVTAPTAVAAEAGAKAVLLHGERGLVWAEEQNWITAALVVWHDGNVYATTGWEMAA